NILTGVSGKMGSLLGLENMQVLSAKENTLQKLYTYIPNEKLDEVRQAVFKAGAGQIGKYSSCSFNTPGIGTFKAEAGADPYVGEVGHLHKEEEVRVEIIFPFYLRHKVITALKEAHPYEEVAYDIITLSNNCEKIGSGITGNLPKPIDAVDFLQLLKETFNVPVIRHTELLNKKIEKVALCGGAGSFLMPSALAMAADIYITGDVKYHEFFDADNRLIIADIGHYESEQFTINLLHELLELKFPNFAVLKTGVNTNPL